MMPDQRELGSTEELLQQTGVEHRAGYGRTRRLISGWVEDKLCFEFTIPCAWLVETRARLAHTARLTISIRLVVFIVFPSSLFRFIGSLWKLPGAI
jgi:hypothetical protein